MMNSVIKIFCMGSVALLLHSCSNGHSTTPKPTVVFDSTKIVAPGVATDIIFQGKLYIDTGMFVTVKGFGFDVKYKNEYFLDIRHDNTKLLNTDTIDYTGLRNTVLSDPNLLTVTDTSISFKLSKYMLDHTRHDSAFAYFLKLKRGSDSKDVANNIINYRGYVKLRTSLPILPVFKMLRDTLVINKTYQSKNKNIIEGSYSLGQIKVMIHGLEYPSKDGCFISTSNYTAPSYKQVTLGLVATQDLFTLPDGWHDFEIYESGGKQRKFVEETGKTKIYIKNEQ